MRTAKTVGHLFKDQRTARNRQFAVDFHPAVDGPRMHHQDIGLRASEPRFAQTEQVRVLANTWKHRFALPFVLNFEAG